jgi:hypothetical protein
VVFSKGSTIRWFRPSKAFHDLEVFVNVRANLDSQSLAASLIRERKPISSALHVPASAWFAPGAFDRDANVCEQSIAMPNYDAALTMLWVDEDLSTDDSWDFDV